MTPLSQSLWSIGLSGVKPEAPFTKHSLVVPLAGILPVRGMCSGERAAMKAGEGCEVRCIRCREFAPESDMTPTDAGNVCPECHAMAEDNP